MRAVDVHIHGREAVGETLGDETLRGQVIALVEIVFAEYVKYAGVTLETGRVKRYAIEYMSDAAESRPRRFQGHPAHQAMNFITQTQQVVGEVTPILAGNSSNQRSLCHNLFLKWFFK